MIDGQVDRAHGDAGFSLVEVLLAIVILGITIVTLMGGLAVAIRGSDYHESSAQVETVLHAAIEKVKDPSVAHVNCAYPTSPAPAGFTYAPSYNTAAQAAAAQAGTPPQTVQITAIQYWDGNNFGALCYDDAAHEYVALQLITIKVTAASGRASNSLSFIKGCARRDTVDGHCV